MQYQTHQPRILEKTFGKRIKLKNKPGSKPMSEEERQRRVTMRKQRADRKYKRKKQKNV